MTEFFCYLVGVFCGAATILLLLTPDYVNKIRTYERLKNKENREE